MPVQPTTGETEPSVCPQCGGRRDWRGVCPACVLGVMLQGGAPRAAAEDVPIPVATPSAQRAFAGRFEILDEIGVGGTGRVWRARQTELGREVALKTLRLGNLGPEADELRLRREAQVVARLRHPGIVALYEFGEAEGIPFLVMELVRGESLAQRLRGGPLSPPHAAQLVRDLAEAVSHAHQAQIIHRDLKPSNVLLDAERGGAPRLTDFGIARILEDPQPLTATGEGLGTASYLAPEQASLQRDQQGPATDVYGLGAVLFHCLTGRAPFVGDSAAAVVRAVIEEEPPAPRTLNPTIPKDLNTLCLRALEKDPRRRYATAAALRDDLDRFLQRQPVLARPVGVVERSWRWAWRHPELSGALTLALGLLTALAWVRERSQHQLAHTVTQLELQRAAVLFRDGQVAEGMAQLASTIRRDPNSPVASARLWSALHHRPWIRPLGILNEGSNLVARLGGDPAGDWVVWAPAEGEVEVRKADSWEPLGPRRTLHAFPLQIGAFPGATIAYALDANGRLDFWQPRTGTSVPLPESMRQDPVLAVSMADLSGGSAAALKSGSICVFHPEDATRRAVHLMHGRDLGSVHFAESGSRLVSWGRDGRWILWSPAEQRAVTQGLIKPPIALESAQLSPDGRWLVVASSDGHLTLYDAHDGRARGTHLVEGRPTGVVFSAAGDRLLTADVGGTVQLLEINDGWRPIQRWATPVVVAALHREGRGNRAVGCTVQGQWRVWDLASGRPGSEWFSHGHGTRGALFVHRGTELLTLSRENELRRWRLSPFSPSSDAHIEAPGFWNDYSAQRIAPAPSNQCVIAARGTSALLVGWSPDGRLRTNAIHTRSHGLIERVSTRGNLALLWSPLHPDAELWNLRDAGPTRRLPSDGQRVSAAAWLPSGAEVALALADGRVQLHALETSQPARDLDLPTFRSIPLEVNPDGSPADNTLRRGEAHRYSMLSASPDARQLAAVGTDHAVHRWDLASGKPIGPPVALRYIATWVDWSPDSQTFAVASWAYAAQAFSTRTGLPAGPLLEHKDGVSHVAFSPDGRHLVTASLDGSARLWNWRTGEPIGRPLTHDSDVGMASYSPDQRWVLTASTDGTSRVWDATTGFPVSEALSVLGPPERSARDALMEARFTPDGRRVVTLHRSGRIGSFAWYPPTAAAPSWAAEIAEALGGQRLNARGLIESAPGLPLQRPAFHAARAAGWTEWLDLLYAPANTPNSAAQPSSPPSSPNHNPKTRSTP